MQMFDESPARAGLKVQLMLANCRLCVQEVLVRAGSIIFIAKRDTPQYTVHDSPLFDHSHPTPHTARRTAIAWPQSKSVNNIQYLQFSKHLDAAGIEWTPLLALI